VPDNWRARWTRYCKTSAARVDCLSFVGAFEQHDLKMTKSDLHGLIAGCKLGVISSLSSSGSAQSALVGIAVTQDLEIIFDTVKTSRKYSNLTSNPKCSLVIGWAGERTVQYEGVASELAGTEMQCYQKTYFEAWPDGPLRMAWPGIVYFVVRPTWIRYSDFDANPPLIHELRF
jgi:pyridoxine/pyridoxamine 5'-phosphate oxidase